MTEQGTPHEVVDNVLDGIVGGAQGIVSGISGGLASAGGMVQSGLDAPWKAMNGPEQPLRAVDRLLNGSLQAGTHAINQGVLGALKEEGSAVQAALDHPSQQLGIPPRLGGGMGRSPLRNLGKGNFPRLPFGR